MANTGDVSKGAYIRYNGDVCQITEWMHRTPGNLRAFYQAKMRVIRTGKIAENRFRSGESVELVRIEVRNMQFLYRDGDALVCMNTETFEQTPIREDLFGNAVKYLKETMEVEIGFEGNEPLFARPPKTVDLTISHTEPGVKGDTANKVMKPATLETGAEVSVPIFLNQDDVIRVDTETGAYMSRVNS